MALGFRPSPNCHLEKSQMKAKRKGAFMFLYLGTLGSPLILLNMRVDLFRPHIERLKGKRPTFISH